MQAQGIFPIPQAIRYRKVAGWKARSKNPHPISEAEEEGSLSFLWIRIREEMKEVASFREGPGPMS